MSNHPVFSNGLKSSMILALVVAFTCVTNFEVKAQSVPDLEGTWRGWGGVELKKDTDLSYTGIYEDTYGEDEGRILLEFYNEVDGEYSGEWWEGDARIGKLTFHVSSDGNSIRGTWCALDSSRIKPGNPPCSKPSTFHWYR